MAHVAIAKHAMTADDLALAATNAQRALRASATMSTRDRVDWAYVIADGYLTSAEVTALRAGGAAGSAVLDSGAKTVLPLRDAGSYQQMELQQKLSTPRPAYAFLATTAPPLSATHWYPASVRTTWPRAGHATLIVFVSHMCGARCYPMYATLRRLNAKYASSGLDLILVSSTTGSFRNQLPATPAAESELARGYFLDFLALPGVMAMDEASFSHKSDGRRMNDVGANQRNYFRGRSAVLVGKNGNVRWVVDASPETERILDHMIASEMGGG
jgi:hypothetical protein